MCIGSGLFDIGFAAALIGLFALIFLNKLKYLFVNDSYRDLQIVTSNKTDVSELIKLLKRKYLKILHLDKERDYVENTLKIIFSFKIHSAGVTDKLSHDIISDIEKSGIKLIKIKWTHR